MGRPHPMVPRHIADSAREHRARSRAETMECGGSTRSGRGTMSQITERITSFHDWPAPESFDALKRFLAHFHYGPVKWTEDPKAWPNDAYPTDTDGTIEELNGCYARGLLTD